MYIQYPIMGHELPPITSRPWLPHPFEMFLLAEEINFWHNPKRQNDVGRLLSRSALLGNRLHMLHKNGSLSLYSYTHYLSLSSYTHYLSLYCYKHSLSLLYYAQFLSLLLNTFSLSLSVSSKPNLWALGIYSRVSLSGFRTELPFRPLGHSITH